MIALAEWAPECYRDIDGNYVVQKLELAIMHGASVGLGPIAAVQSIAIINGKPSIWGDGALSVIEHSGLLEDMAEDYDQDETQGVIAVCTMKRRSRVTPVVNRFSVAMAEQAGLTRIEGPWQSYPERMLRMRARSWTMRDAFADVLRGLHIREEVEDFIGRERLPHPVAAISRAVRGQAKEPPEKSTATSSIRRLSGPAGVTTSSPIAPVIQDEIYSLLGADGGSADVAGVTALRAEFERLIFDKHLTAKQVLGVWESNEAARQVLDAACGGLLPQLEDYVMSLQDTGSPRPSEKIIPAETLVADVSMAQVLEAAADLRVEIDPTWGVQKIFHRYREALERLALKTAATQSEIALFRLTNATIENRLRMSLPERMVEIDARYGAKGDRPPLSPAPLTIGCQVQEVSPASQGAPNVAPSIEAAQKQCGQRTAKNLATPSPLGAGAPMLRPQLQSRRYRLCSSAVSIECRDGPETARRLWRQPLSLPSHRTAQSRCRRLW